MGGVVEEVAESWAALYVVAFGAIVVGALVALVLHIRMWRELEKEKERILSIGPELRAMFAKDIKQRLEENKRRQSVASNMVEIIPSGEASGPIRRISSMPDIVESDMESNAADSERLQMTASEFRKTKESLPGAVDGGGAPDVEPVPAWATSDNKMRRSKSLESALDRSGSVSSGFLTEEKREELLLRSYAKQMKAKARKEKAEQERMRSSSSNRLTRRLSGAVQSVHIRIKEATATPLMALNKAMWHIMFLPVPFYKATNLYVQLVTYRAYHETLFAWRTHAGTVWIDVIASVFLVSNFELYTGVPYASASHIYLALAWVYTMFVREKPGLKVFLLLWWLVPVAAGQALWIYFKDDIWWVWALVAMIAAPLIRALGHANCRLPPYTGGGQDGGFLTIPEFFEKHKIGVALVFMAKSSVQGILLESLAFPRLWLTQGVEVAISFGYQTSIGNHKIQDDVALIWDKGLAAWMHTRLLMPTQDVPHLADLPNMPPPVARDQATREHIRRMSGIDVPVQESPRSGSLSLRAGSIDLSRKSREFVRRASQDFLRKAATSSRLSDNNSPGGRQSLSATVPGTGMAKSKSTHDVDDDVDSANADSRNPNHMTVPGSGLNKSKSDSFGVYSAESSPTVNRFRRTVDTPASSSGTGSFSIPPLAIPNASASPSRPPPQLSVSQDVDDSDVQEITL